jgi:hypothetical protein
MVVHRRVRKPQNLGCQTEILEDDSNQILGIAPVEIERSDHDLIGVVAKRRYTLAMEDPPDAEFELIFLVEASSGVELESLVDAKPPVFLFDRKGEDLRAGGRRQEAGGSDPDRLRCLLHPSTVALSLLLSAAACLLRPASSSY